VGRYRSRYKTYILISRREVREKGDVDEFDIEWALNQSEPDALEPSGDG
jgi:hypothetical protein